MGLFQRSAKRRRQEWAHSIPPAWDGEHVDVDTFWAQAWAELTARQAILSDRLQLASAEWRVDQNAGLIEFTRKDGIVVRAPVQIVGCYAPRLEAFIWGWDHPSVLPRLRQDAQLARQFGDKHNLPELTQRMVKATEAEAWHLAAVTMKISGAAAVYRGPAEEGGPIVFMTLRELTALPRWSGT
jgi:hypothetical protein